MKNYVQPGETLTLVAPYTRTAGQGALVGGLFGVAKNDVLSGASGEFAMEGVFNLAKVGSQAWAVGDRIHWDDSNKRCTTDGTAGPLIGTAAGTVGSGAGETLGDVLLEPPGLLTSGHTCADLTMDTNITAATANGSLADIAAAAGACAGGATPTAAQVDTAIATAVAPIVSGTNEQLKELGTKINALQAKLRLAGILA